MRTSVESSVKAQVHVVTNVNVMDKNDAKELLAWANARVISDQDRCRRIIARYCTQNKEVIWKDALKEYELFVHDG